MSQLQFYTIMRHTLILCHTGWCLHFWLFALSYPVAGAVDRPGSIQRDKSSKKDLNHPTLRSIAMDDTVKGFGLGVAQDSQDTVYCLTSNMQHLTEFHCTPVISAHWLISSAPQLKQEDWQPFLDWVVTFAAGKGGKGASKYDVHNFLFLAPSHLVHIWNWFLV